MHSLFKNRIFQGSLATGFFVLALGLAFSVYKQTPSHKSPTEIFKAIEAKTINEDSFFLNGFIERGSVRDQGDDHYFKITDLQNAISVHYWGLPPENYQEAQAIIAWGNLLPKVSF